MAEQLEWCDWIEDEDGNWATSCDNLHILLEGTPHENGMAFCCYCGSKLRFERFHADE